MLLLILGGCCSNRQNITVNISNYYWDKNVYVDVACLNDNLLDQYEECSKKDYWGIDSDLRNQLHSRNLVFNMYSPLKQTIAEDSSFWEDHQADDYLALFTDISPKDPEWKMIIPLEHYSWFNFWSNKDIHVYISKDGIGLLDEDLVFSKKVTIPQEDIRKYIE